MKIAFVGLGAMGLPMARRLLQAGHSVRGVDVSERNRAAFEAAGGQWMSAEQAVADVDLVWLMVVNGDQANDFLLTQGHAARMAPGTIVATGCTQPATNARALAEQLQTLGLRMLDAPVSGGVVGAEAGSLAIMVGGPTEVLEEARPVLSVLGSNLFHMGQAPGAGSTMKMINQLLCGVHIAVAAEAMQLADYAGLDLAQVLQIVNVSAGNSWMWGNRGPRMIQADPEVTSAVDIFVKDLSIVNDEARQLKTAVPLAAQALQMFLAASGLGHGQADDSQVIRAYRALNGRAPR